MRAPRSTSDNRRFPAAPRTTSRPLPGRARSAAPTARKKCTGHMRARLCMCVYTCPFLRAYVCTGATGHRDTKGLQAHDRRRSHSRSRSRLHRVAAGVRWCSRARGMPSYRARVDRTPSYNAQRNGMARRRGRTTRNDGTTSCRLFVLQFSASSALLSSEKCLPCTIDAHRPLSPRPCRLTCAGPGNYPSRATGLRAIAAVKGWRDLPFKFREGRRRSTLTAMCRIAAKNGR